MFVRGDVKDANADPNAKKVVYAVTDAEEREIYGKAASGYGRSLAPIGFCHENPVLTSVGVRLTDLDIPEPATQGAAPFVRDDEREIPSKTVSNTGELRWNGEIKDRGFYQVDSPKTKVFTGFVNGREFTFSDGTRFIPGKSILDWMTISMTQVDGQREPREPHRQRECVGVSQNWLVAATGFVRNTEMKVRVYEKGEKDLKAEDAPGLTNEELAGTLDENLTSSKTNGIGPNLCEGVSAKIQIPVCAGAAAFCYPLDGEGNRMNGFQAKMLSETMAEVELSAKYQTLWYEIEVK